jgi:hypothetical protein
MGNDTKIIKLEARYVRLKTCKKCGDTQVFRKPSEPLLQLDYQGEILKWREIVVSRYMKYHKCNV